MSASLQFFSLTPQTLPVHHSSSAAAVSASSLLAPSSLKPLPKLVLSFTSIGNYAHPASRFVRNVAFSSEVDEEVEDEEDEDEDSDFSGSEEPSYSADVKLFVGNLPFTVDSAALAALFERAGNVEMVEVIYDKQSGRSRGFAFVTMASVKEAEAAAQQFNGYELQGRPLRVNSGPPPAKTENSFRGDNNSSFRDNNSSYRGDNNSSSYRGDRSSSRGDNSFRGGDRSSSRGGDRSSFRGDDSSSYRGGNSSFRGDDSSSYRGDRSSSFRGDDSSSFRGSRDRSSSDSSNRLYVGNLAWGVDNLTLETLFSEQGRVQEAAVVYDRESGRSRGFGFVTYGSSKDVDNAISALDGLDVKGRSIRVSRAEARPKREF